MSAIILRPGTGMDAAVSRASKTIVLMVDAALGHLKDIGYERGFDDVEIDPRDGLPAVKLDGRVIFEVALTIDPEKGISLDGEWRATPPKKSLLWLRRAWRWLMRKTRLARAA